MNKSIKKLLGTACGIVMVMSLSDISVCAQSDQGGSSDARPGQPSDSQNPNGGPGPQGSELQRWYRPGFGSTGQVGPPQVQGQAQPSPAASDGQRFGDFYAPTKPRSWSGDGHMPGDSFPGGQGSLGADGHGPDQGPGNSGPGGRGQWGGGQGMSPEQRQQRKERMMKMFDKNGDGQLDDQEKAKMHAFMEQRRQERMQRQGQGGGPGTQ